LKKPKKSKKLTKYRKQSISSSSDEELEKFTSQKNGFRGPYRGGQGFSQSTSEYEGDDKNYSSSEVNKGTLNKLKEELKGLREIIEELKAKEGGKETSPKSIDKDLDINEDDDCEMYERRVRIDPCKLQEGMDFRIWLESFQLYVGRFNLKKAFNLEVPIKINDKEERKQNFAQSILLNWVGDSYKEVGLLQ